MTQDIVVYVQDMQTFLKADEYQTFVRAQEEVEQYIKRYRDYEIKKSGDEWAMTECQKRRSEAKSDVERSVWDSERFRFTWQSLTVLAPVKPTRHFYEHDRFIELVRERKLRHIKEEESRKADEEVKRRREEERRKREQEMMVIAIKRKMAADSEWEQFQNTLKSTIKELKHQLANPKPPKFLHKCAPEVLNYHPEEWCDLELPSDDEVSAWVKPQILEKIPEVLRPYVTWGLNPQILVIPKVEYQVIGVPCLVWHFLIYVATKVGLWLKESTISKEFFGWKHAAAIKAQKIGSFFLKPQFWGSQEGLKTPIALLRILAEGKLEATGIEVETTYIDGSIYTVEGFEERRLEHYYITVQEEFRRFINDICKKEPLGQGLLVRGLTDEVTAMIVELKWNEPLPVTDKQGDTGGSDSESVVGNLLEVGWTEDTAKKAVETTPFPPGASVEDKVKIILAKSCVDSA